MSSLLLLAHLAWADVPLLGPEPPPQVETVESTAPAEPAVYGPLAPPPEAAPATEAPADPLAALPSASGTAVAPQGTALDSWLDQSPQESSSGSRWSWVMGLLGLGAAGVMVLMRKQLQGKLTQSDQKMEILARQNLGGNAALVLMEVEAQDGETRRLLIGLGDGAPKLVSDLGGSIPGFLIPNDSPELTQQRQPSVQVEIEDTDDEDTAGDSPVRPHVVASAPKRQRARPSLVGRFTSADLAPIDEEPESDGPAVVKAWQSPPSGPKPGPAPRLRAEVDKQEFLSTRDIVGRRM